ncbi:MAG: S41 family peptidase [Longimicrobiales bacterium]|nr:S41 family peptidase [Longimicrobiales bacterium]
MARRHWRWLVLVFGLASCTDAGPAEPDGAMSLVAHNYLSSALLIMELNSVRRYEIDWEVFREETMAFAAGAETTADTYAAIEDALRRIGDGHSFFRAPVEQAPPSEGEDPEATLLGDVGYLDVPAFSGGGSEGDALATRYHRIIEEVDTLGASCRWVVDLRGNTGGNMWPMLAGVGPILGEGTLGYFVDPDSVKKSWVYADGEARIDDGAIAAVSAPYELAALPNVAVLTDSLTASSGEAVVVAFRGREDARSFGAATWGCPPGTRPSRWWTEPSSSSPSRPWPIGRARSMAARWFRTSRWRVRRPAPRRPTPRSTRPSPGSEPRPALEA